MRRVAGLASAATLFAALPLWAATVQVGQPVMGTILQVTVVAADEGDAHRLAERAIAEARRWDDILTTWRPEGELARLNAKAGQGAVTISPDLTETLRTMKRFSQATSGLFEPAVGRLVHLWSESAPPSPDLLARARGQRIATALTLDDNKAALAADVALDAGGIGKGIALDRIASMLRGAGVEAAFLNFGGSSQLAVGAPSATPQGWTVIVAGLEPGSTRGELLLRDAALSTSRSTGPGAKQGPIVDPRSGTPITERRVATILAPDATTAEAWSKVPVLEGRGGVDAVRAAGLDVFYEDSLGPVATDGFRISLPAPDTRAPTPVN